MECGHASVREWTKLRGRGHTPDLCEVSAKAVCKFVSKHHHLYSTQDGTGKAQEDQAEQGDRCRPKRAGGGGPWRAYLAEVSKGVKLSRAALRERELSKFASRRV